MRAQDPHTAGINGRMPRASRRTLRRLVPLLIVFAGTASITAVAAGSALANSYNGLLYGGTLSINAGTANESGGFVYGDDSWTAPSGSTIGGFAYTSGAFFSDTSDSVGGISAGFGGNGSANQPTILFPWTSDCAISNSGHYWAYSAGGTIAGTNGNAICSTSGSTGGWNYDNSEIENTSPGTNPESDYSTLWLTVFCQAGTCKYTGNSPTAAYASVTNLSARFDDSYSQPSGGVSWSSGINGSSWVQTNSGNVTLSASASDPDGVCSMQASLSGPENIAATLGNQNPGTTDVGDEIGTEFEYGTNPCWVGQTDSGSWTLPGGLPSGSYSASLQASNPGNYEAQGFSASGSPTISTTGSVPIDDQTPTVQLLSPTGSGGWTSSNRATVDVSTGPSGLSSLSCTDNGSGDGATLQSNSGDSWVYTVPLSSGTNDLSCSGANGDSNGALVGSSGTQLYQQDSVVPSITFSDSGYTPGTWTASQQRITVTATGGPSGISGLVCTLDGNTLPDSFGDTDFISGAGSTQTGSVTVPANGAHDLACSADNTGTPSIVGSGNYQVDVDSQIPIATFMTSSGYAATSTHASDPDTASGQNWLNGANTITIGVTGTEPTVESGVQTVTCTINGDTAGAETLTNVPTTGTVAANTPFEATFVANTTNGWIDGQNAIACQSTTVAGLTGADGQSSGTSSVEYVDVNDASWPLSPGQPQSAPTPGKCGISSVIDSGGCPYSDGPSQTVWYSSSQTVRITADDTGAAAPITSITCSGTAMPASAWTAAADSQDVDSHNGLTVTATVDAPGGKLDCSASDSASPVDTYELGTYNVSIDPDPPTGHFEAQGANGAAKNILQLNLSSPGGSGIKQVAVQAKDENTGKIYTGGELTGNPADGSTAFATLDPATGSYNLTVDPNAFPGLNDKVAFTATPMTNAGLTATLTTTADGGAEVVTPIQLGQNPDPGLVLSTTGDSTSVTATARAGKWVAASVEQSGLPASLNGSPSSPVAPTTVATVAKWSRSVCKPARKKSGDPARKGKKAKPAKKTAKRSCRSLTTKAPRSEGLPANYGQKLQVTGVLMDTTTNTPISGGTVLIYATNLTTGAVKLVDTAKTGPRGGFGYRLPAGPGRRVDLVYVGTDSTKGIDSAFDTTTAGKLQAHAARTVHVGQHMRITGRILGGSIGGKGALVQMWYRIEGHTRTWEPFKPGRSNLHGGFAIRYPITAGDKGLTYQVRIKVPDQAGWGFRGATSNVLRFHVG
jgi:hypothetical protein